MLKIAGAKVFKNGEFVEDDIFIEGDRIVATGDEMGEVIDAKGLLAIPGLSTCIPMVRWGMISATARMSQSTPSRATRPAAA